MTLADDPIVVCSVLEREAAMASRRIEQAPARCGLVELRADFLRAEQIASIVERAHRPLVVTVRRVADGGGFTGSEEERRRSLLAALAVGARYVDVELRSALEGMADGEFSDRVILSHHGGPCRSEALRAALHKMCRRRAARLKIVPTAESPSQAIAVRDALALARASDRSLACFASGRAGSVTRLLAPVWGSWASYGSAARGVETAAAQFTAEELLDLYDVTSMHADTRRFALVGTHVSRSPSPAMHRAGFLEAGLDARYFPVEADSFDDCMALAESAGFHGLAVTMPFKSAAFERCVEVDELARAGRAVNTMRFDAKGWVGFNTDGPAMLTLIRRWIDPATSTVALVGAGGTARVAAAVLSAAGAQVEIFNRSPERGAAAAGALGIGHASLDELPDATWDILVQATPLGAAGERLLPANRLCGKLVLDAVYGAATPLVRDARARGLVAIDGFDLLVAQAVLQFERLTGRSPNEATLRRAGAAWLVQQQSGASA